MAGLSFCEEEQQTLTRERFEHPHPRVQRRMEVLWLISQGLTYDEAARLGGVGRSTVDRYVAIYRKQGVDGLRRFHWSGPASQLMDHKETLEESFLNQPPKTVAEARQRIKDLTGIDRGPTQVRAFLKKCWA